MPKVSEIGPGTEVGKLILHDFLNWKTSGFKPWGKGIGGRDHYTSCSQYQRVSHYAFRSQAKKIARIAMEQMPAQEALDNTKELEVNKVQKEPENATGADDERSLPIDSENRNPWIRFGNQDEEDELNDSDDENYSSNTSDKSCGDDGLEGFDDISLGELQNSRTPFLAEYPTKDKVLVIFPLDGNISDADSNQFEFINDNTGINRWGKVPKERENCVALIGLGTEKASKMGFTDVDLMVVDAEIQKRLKANHYERDQNGDIWEVRATLQLPFKCKPQFYSRDGTALKTFRMRSNSRGFAWGYFWLLAWTPPKPKPAKRIGGKLVKIMAKEDASLYTEETYTSNKRVR